MYVRIALFWYKYIFVLLEMFRIRRTVLANMFVNFFYCFRTFSVFEKNT